MVNILPCGPVLHLVQAWRQFSSIQLGLFVHSPSIANISQKRSLSLFSHSVTVGNTINMLSALKCTLDSLKKITYECDLR